MKNQKQIYRPDKGPYLIGMTKKEIAQLVYWAAVGVASSKGGSYKNTISDLVLYFSKELKITLPVRPYFKAPLPN